MTVEEITQTLQTVAENQAHLDETVKQIAVAHKSVVELVRRHEERIDGQDVNRRESDERIEALINAQVRHEARREELEEAYKLVARSHATIVKLLERHEERLDGHDRDLERTDGRLDAVIDDQISARSQAEERGRLLDEKLARLQEAQARADEQIRLLAARNGG